MLSPEDAQKNRKLCIWIWLDGGVMHEDRCSEPALTEEEFLRLHPVSPAQLTCSRTLHKASINWWQMWGRRFKTNSNLCKPATRLHILVNCSVRPDKSSRWMHQVQRQGSRQWVGPRVSILPSRGECIVLARPRWTQARAHCLASESWDGRRLRQWCRYFFIPKEETQAAITGLLKCRGWYLWFNDINPRLSCFSVCGCIQMRWQHWWRFQQTLRAIRRRASRQAKVWLSLIFLWCMAVWPDAQSPTTTLVGGLSSSYQAREIAKPRPTLLTPSKKWWPSPCNSKRV